MASSATPKSYEFGPFRLVPSERLLLRNDETVALTPKVFDLLLMLVRHNGHLVAKDELLKEVWPDTFIEEGSLARSISALRKVLGNNADGGAFIETVSKRGYRFAADVRESENKEATRSVAVLPFTNLSAETDNEYFCDGLAEEILNALAKIDDLKVAARTSAFSFKGKNATVSEIGRALNVQSVLEGAVRKSANRLRITVQLIDAVNGYHLWSERYDRKMEDIFEVQDEITLAIVASLKVTLFGEEKAAVLKRHTHSSEAYQLYLKGIYLLARYTPNDSPRAIENFNQAIAIDPNYALAYAGLSVVYTQMSFWHSPSETMLKAKAAARKAVDLSDTLAEAHTSAGVIKLYYDWDYRGADEEFRRGITLNSGNAYTHNWYGWYLGLMGRFDESLAELARARELDPLSNTINAAIGTVFYWARQTERAIEQYQKVLELYPGYYLVSVLLGEAYAQQGNFSAAIAEIQTVQQSRDDAFALSVLGYVYAKSGDCDKAQKIVDDLKTIAQRRYVPPFHIAVVYSGLGDKDQALAWLEQALEERSVWLPWLKVDPKFESLCSDRRFIGLMRRVGLG